MKAFGGYVDEDITFSSGNPLDVLRELKWLRQKESLLSMGALEIDKTHIATALGSEA
ncbi:hypothetical protein D3C77_424560 [compost metagenome]